LQALHALQNIGEIQEETTKDFLFRNVGRMLEKYVVVQRKIILLFDASSEMNQYKYSAVDLALRIFDECAMNDDKISLMTFTKNVYVMFSQVEKWKNTENLKNQLRNLRNVELYFSSFNLRKYNKTSIFA